MSQDRELVAKILDSIAILVSLDKKRIVTHKSENLHPSEVQLLLFLDHVQATNITAIAEKMGLTKGAISQTLTRLEKKGIIRKKSFPEKKNELEVKFTESGVELLTQLNKSKKSIEGKYQRYIQTLSEKEKQAISNFLDKMVSIASNS
ncbi:MAG: MarR family transcriptional regulator [Candidatus Thorarchaeota archaeon]|nr:MAG: MarR family transcriptional regulator [Candidatus Thorarchaeota archaeon]